MSRRRSRLGQSGLSTPAVVTAIVLVILIGAGLGGLALRSSGEDPVAGSPTPSPSTSPEASSPESTSPAPSSPAASSPAVTSSTSPSTTITKIVEVWLWNGRRGWLAWTTQMTDVRDQAILRAAITELLEADTSGNPRTLIPPTTRIRGISINDGTAIIDLTRDFKSGLENNTDSKPDELRFRAAQVVFTATQFATVRRVEIRAGGKPVFVGNGDSDQGSFVTGRRDYDDIAPPIVVNRPRAAERVESPVLVSGTANVFEATVSIRIRNANGRVIARAFTTATCGSGCRGTFSKRVPYSVTKAQFGTVEVYEASAKDGRPLHVIMMPVVLRP